MWSRHAQWGSAGVIFSHPEGGGDVCHFYLAVGYSHTVARRRLVGVYNIIMFKVSRFFLCLWCETKGVTEVV